VSYRALEDSGEPTLLTLSPEHLASESSEVSFVRYQTNQQLYRNSHPANHRLTMQPLEAVLMSSESEFQSSRLLLRSKEAIADIARASQRLSRNYWAPSTHSVSPAQSMCSGSITIMMLPTTSFLSSTFELALSRLDTRAETHSANVAQHAFSHLEGILFRKNKVGNSIPKTMGRIEMT
jgi:hypothetical protein